MNYTNTFAIIQLTRMGDLIQTYQACIDFKEQNPNIKLILICRKQFAGPLGFILKKAFDEIIEIDLKELAANNNPLQLDKYLSATRNVIEGINHHNIDVLLNFSFCETSNYLSSCIKTNHRLGTYKSPDNTTIVNDQWSQVIHTMTQRGSMCPYNLVDIFKNILGITPQITNLKIEREVHNILAIHPFASHDKKKWKINKWSEIIYSFLKDHPNYAVSLFGSTNEASEIDYLLNEPILKKYLSRIQSHVGILNIEDAFNKLKDCSHFIGHDSLIGHLAQVANIPTLTIALGTVREVETIPYGENAFVISPKTNCYPCFPDTACDFYQCHTDISYQAVSPILSQFISTSNITDVNLQRDISAFHLNSLNIYKASFSNTGWLYLEQLNQADPTTRELSKTFLRVAFNYKFEEKEENFPLPKLNSKTHHDVIQISDGIKQLFELCEFGKKYSRYILSELATTSPRLSLIKDYSNKIEEIDGLMDLVQKTNNHLAPIVDYYKVTKSNLVGTTLVELTESSYLVYNDNATVCSIIYELISATIQNYLPSPKSKLQKAQGS